MQTFDSDGVEIAFIDEGDGEPVLLIHGFASNVAVNWIDTGWVETLCRAGYRVIAFDNRGHGQSQKFYDEGAYGAPLMAADAGRLTSHLAIPRADIIGYSMGARVCAFLAMRRPELVRSAVFAGLGVNMVRGLGGSGPIARALEAKSAGEVASSAARTFRIFAESTRSDLRALAACIRSLRDQIGADELAALDLPVLVAVGTDDVIGGSAAKLAALIPGARALDIEGCDHMKAVGDKTFKEGVLAFLARRP